MKAGVIDPTMLTRTGLQNAASITSLLTTETMITRTARMIAFIEV